MSKSTMTNIDKQILIEKGNFISRNSTFFHNNLDNMEILNSLKNILLDPTPLAQCPDYEELAQEIKESKVRNIDELNYHCSFETLFAIINMIRRNFINLDENSKSDKIETLRLYVKYIPEQTKYVSKQTNDDLYYSLRSIIFIDSEKAKTIIESDKQYVKKGRSK